LRADKKGAVERVQGQVANAVVSAELRGAQLVVGLSGGVDSVVLLHALAALRATLSLRLRALHVHHGLSANADAWAQFCVAFCNELGIELVHERVAVDRASALGTEAAARELRYGVFRRQSADAIVLAHHQDDQAETVLLQLLRGAGVRGSSAMPPVRVLDEATGLRLVRPLLGLRRSDILSYARAAGLRWVEDESNADLAYDRNFVRADIMPRLSARFAGTSTTLARAALNFADAAQLLDELAAIDAEGSVRSDALEVAALKRLSAARARNVLRWFLQRQGLPTSSRDQLDEALHQALAARLDGRPRVRLGAAWLRRHRGRLQVERAMDERQQHWSRVWAGEARVDLPAGLGGITFEAVTGAGLSAGRLRACQLVIQPRAGGERLRLSPKRPSRTLKNLLQEAGLPHWQRDRLPLLFADGELVWVPEVGIDHRYAAQPGESGVLPRWLS